MKYTQILQFLKNSVLTILFVVVGVSTVFSQDWQRLDIDFRKEGKLVLNRGMNGMVAPQFSNYDFNGDGNEDLFVFDRQSGVTMAFVWDTSGETGRMVFAPEYAETFPIMNSFCRLVDYDRDGDRDIFTFPLLTNASSIQVLRNHGTDADPDFRIVKFPALNVDVINYKSGLSYFPVYTAQSDVPGIADVDGDGDIDFLVFEQNSGSLLGLYQNMQVEKGLPKDSIYLEEADLCWGKFRESGLAADIFLSSSATQCAPGIVGDGKGGTGVRHAGSTIEVYDGNGDGLVDLLIGDLSSGTIVELTNGGTLENAWMVEQDPNFPSYDQGAVIELFLSAFYVDVDSDGVRELVVAPNETNSSWNVGHVWMYENIGTDASPIFELATKEFLFETSLRIPESSKPHFIDINQDGLLDLLVGSDGEKSANQGTYNHLIYYKNTGTMTEPKFTFEEDDFLNLSEVQGLNKLHPTSGDLDNDGDLDLLIGVDEGELIYYENIAEAGQPLQFAAPVFDYMGIDVGKESKPCIVDLDEDGLLDLAIGEEGDRTDLPTGRKGGISYYRNIGTATEPMFDADPSMVALGGVFTRSIRVASGATSPVFVPTDKGDDFIVVAGTNYGPLAMYDQVLGNINDTFNLVSDALPVPRYGRRTGLDLADIDNDNFYEMVVGNQNGGLAFHNTTLQVSFENATEDNFAESVKVYPNPAAGRLTIQTDGRLPDSYQLLGLGGNVIVSKRLVDSSVDLENIPAGFYLIRLNFGLTTVVRKFVVQK